jgi:hypothetical protein
LQVCLDWLLRVWKLQNEIGKRMKFAVNQAVGNGIIVDIEQHDKGITQDFRIVAYEISNAGYFCLCDIGIDLVVREEHERELPVEMISQLVECVLPALLVSVRELIKFAETPGGRVDFKPIRRQGHQSSLKQHCPASGEGIENYGPRKTIGVKKALIGGRTGRATQKGSTGFSPQYSKGQIAVFL